MTKDKVLLHFDAISKIMKNYIYYFYEKHKNDGSYSLLNFNENNIVKFESNVQKQAIKIIKKMKDSCMPDRHKIISVCLKSFISAHIFNFNLIKYEQILSNCTCEDDNLSIYTIYPNEMFCIEIIKIILDEYSKYKNIDNYNLSYANNIIGMENVVHSYIIDLFKLILGYEKNSLDFVVQELAHIIFFIEMGYEVSVKGLAHMYYKINE